MDRFLADRGFLTFAVGKEYLPLARLQAMSVKITQKSIKNHAVIVDELAAQDIHQDDHDLFDKIIVIEHKASGWDMSQEHQAFSLSPWRHTFKVEADIIFTADMSHWWTALVYRDMAVANRIYDFRDQLITSRQHRQLFDENLLPDVYSGLCYFRYSQTAGRFYDLVRKITADWDWFATDYLVKNDDLRPRTDEIYAIAARIIGEEQVTWPCDIPTFVHMKEALVGLSKSALWYTQIPSHWTNGKLFVGNYQQSLPFHYHQKGWINEGTYQRGLGDYRKFHEGHGRILREAEAAAGGSQAS